MRKMRKMQVPAYWAVDVGVQCVEYRGVVVEVKNVMAMDEETGEEEEEPMSMPDMEEEEAAGEVEVVEAMEVMVVDIDMPDIEDMFNLFSRLQSQVR